MKRLCKNLQKIFQSKAASNIGVRKLENQSENVTSVFREIFFARQIEIQMISIIATNK